MNAITESMNSLFHIPAWVSGLVIAPFLALDAIWTLADITNALMVFPNLIALLALRKDVVVETEQFWKEEKARKLKNS